MHAADHHPYPYHLVQEVAQRQGGGEYRGARFGRHLSCAGGASGAEGDEASSLRAETRLSSAARRAPEVAAAGGTRSLSIRLLLQEEGWKAER